MRDYPEQYKEPCPSCAEAGPSLAVQGNETGAFSWQLGDGEVPFRQKILGAIGEASNY